MNAANWHLLLNHVPIIGLIIGTLILIAGYLLKNNAVVKQTALGVLLFSALASLPAYFTGEGAEELVEKIPGVTDQFIEAHEDLGKVFLILVITLGVLSAAALMSGYIKSKLSTSLNIVVLIVSIGACVLAKEVGTSGGEIRHTEIRKNGLGEATNAGEEDGNEKNNN